MRLLFALGYLFAFGAAVARCQDAKPRRVRGGERVTLCGGCLALDAAMASTRPYGMELCTIYGTPRHGPPREGDVMTVSGRFGEGEFAMIWEPATDAKDYFRTKGKK